MTEKIARISRPLSWRHDFIRQHDYRCHYCNRFAGTVEVGPDGKPWHVEHMDALAVGGADAEENLTLACERCNSLKHVLPYENFRHYAKAHFWVGKPERISDHDMNSLMTAYLRSTRGEWFYSVSESDVDRVRLHSLASHEVAIETDGCIAEINIQGSTSRPAMGDADFIVLAHRLMPMLSADSHPACRARPGPRRFASHHRRLRRQKPPPPGLHTPAAGARGPRAAAIHPSIP